MCFVLLITNILFTSHASGSSCRLGVLEGIHIPMPARGEWRCKHLLPVMFKLEDIASIDEVASLSLRDLKGT
jgi:hypothetical protein